MNDKKQTIAEWLNEFLSNYDYCMLDKILKVTETKKSRLLSNYDNWEFQHFVDLFTYLKTKEKYILPLSIEQIVEKCEFKTTVTITQAIRINKILNS